MTKEEHSNLVNQILKAETELQRGQLLAQLTNDYDTVLQENNAALTRVTDLEKSNIEYAKLNNDLFLQIGSQNLANMNKTIPPTEPPEPPAKRNFSDLKFD